MSDSRPPLPQRIHLVGIGGVHMSAIAHTLLARGYLVSGSDLRPSTFTHRAAAAGARVRYGHQAGNVGDAKLLVVSSAVAGDNPEVAEAKRRGIPIIKRAEMVARLMEGHQAIAVAGTHGKSTTSSLIAYMLQRAGLAPSFLIGGDIANLNTNVAVGEGPHVVVEADEYDEAFLHYSPYIAVVTNIEPDHLDYYGTYDRLVGAFRRFLDRVVPGGRIVACLDDPTVREIARAVDWHSRNVSLEGYALAHEALWQASDIHTLPEGGSNFSIFHSKHIIGSFTTPLTGTHNITNILSAVAVGHAIGINVSVMAQAVREFRGVRRRFELLGEAAGITIMDDYAHHPTEVRATLAAARERFPGRRLICLFQPHTYSRSQYLLDGFRTCFKGVDELWIAETYAAREPPSAGMDGQTLAAAITKPPARYAGSLAEATSQVLATLRPGDVFFSIGAGDVNEVAQKVLKELKERDGQ